MGTNIIIDFCGAKQQIPKVFCQQTTKNSNFSPAPKRRRSANWTWDQKWPFSWPLGGVTGTGRGPPTSNCFSIGRGGLASNKKRKTIWNHDVEKNTLELWLRGGWTTNPLKNIRQIGSFPQFSGICHGRIRKKSPTQQIPSLRFSQLHEWNLTNGIRILPFVKKSYILQNTVLIF